MRLRSDGSERVGEGQFALAPVCQAMSMQHADAVRDTLREDAGAAASLAELARLPLFEPLRALLLALPGPGPSSLPALNGLSYAGGERQTGMTAMRFVAPDDMPVAYEERIVLRGEVVTRPHNWHDFFNALVWMRFPRTKYGLA